MKNLFRVFMLVVMIMVVPSCRGIQGDQTGPIISDVSTSGNVLVISDCPATSVTITAKVTDASGIKSVLLWYRIGSDQPFESIRMDSQGGLYTASLEGSDLQGNDYGAVEFYVTAEDGAGNSSKSPVDISIQFLPCVNN